MKKLISIFLVLLMLMGFSACGSFAPRSDSVYIKLYNKTGSAIKSFALNEYENFVLKSTTVAQNADGSCFLNGEEIIFEVLDAELDKLSFVIKAEDSHKTSFRTKTISAAMLRRGVIYSYSAEIFDNRLVLKYEGTET